MRRLLPYLKNKYIITTLAFVVWLTFFDRNDFYSQYTYRQKLKKIQQDKAYYVEEIMKNREDMEKLMTNPGNLERFAREKYLMKKDNEDVFVIVNE